MQPIRLVESEPGQSRYGALAAAMRARIVAGEWFAMWQSHTWNGQATAGIFVLLIGVALLHLCGPEADA